MAMPGKLDNEHVCLETQAEHHFAQIGRHYQEGKWPYNVEITIDNQVRGGYAVVLTAHSTFFNSHFKKKGVNSRKVDISSLEITLSGLEHCLKFMTQGFLRLDSDSILEALQASLTLGVDELSKLLEEYLCSLSAPVCLLRALNVVYTAPVSFITKRTIVEHCAERFLSFKESEFNNLTVDAVCGLLSDRTLRVNDDVPVYHAAIRWLTADPEKRVEHTSRVLQCVRFTNMSTEQHKLLGQQLLTDCPTQLAAQTARLALMRAHWSNVCQRLSYSNYGSMEELPRNKSSSLFAISDTDNSTISINRTAGISSGQLCTETNSVKLSEQTSKTPGDKKDEDEDLNLDPCSSFDRVGSLAVIDEVDTSQQDIDHSGNETTKESTSSLRHISSVPSDLTSTGILKTNNPLFAQEMNSTASQKKRVQIELCNYANQLLGSNKPASTTSRRVSSN